MFAVEDWIKIFDYIDQDDPLVTVAWMNGL